MQSPPCKKVHVSGIQRSMDLLANIRALNVEDEYDRGKATETPKSYTPLPLGEILE
jgi:hypothetical protein